MSVITGKLTRPTADGRVPAGPGSIIGTPSTRRELVGEIVLPSSFIQPLEADGSFILPDVDDTDGTWWWTFQEDVARGRVRHCAVNGDSDYADLVDVDPSSGVVKPPLPPVWQSYMDDLIVSQANLQGAPVSIYADSLGSIEAGAAIGLSPAQMFAQLFAAQLEGGEVSVFAAPGTRIDYAVAQLLTDGTWPGLPAPAAGAKWPGVSQRPGFAFLETGTNDMARYAPDLLTPTPIAGPDGLRYMSGIVALYRAALALLTTESRIELDAAGGPADVTFHGPGWVIGQAAAYMSGGKFSSTNVAGESVDVDVPAPQGGSQAGRVYVVVLLFDSAYGLNAPIERLVDGVAAGTWNPPAWEPYAGVTLMPAVVPIDVPIDGKRHTVTLRHAGANGQYICPDVVLVPSAHTPARFVMQAPDPIVGTLWDAGDVATWKANRALLEPQLLEVLEEFDCAEWTPAGTLQPDEYWTDGVHLTALGHLRRAGQAIAAFRARVRRLLHPAE